MLLFEPDLDLFGDKAYQFYKKYRRRMLSQDDVNE